MGIVKDIHKEWKENAEANEPMPDPEDHVNPPSLRHVMSQSPLNHIKAIREAMKLYKKTIFDSKEAIREAQVVVPLEEDEDVPGEGRAALRHFGTPEGVRIP